MSGNAANSLDAWGILRAAEVVDLAGSTGLELAGAAVLLEKESSGGRNVWGHDNVSTGGFYVKGSPVTREDYTAWRPHRARLGSQGVGPCQLTWSGYQDRADALGGCWDWRSNVRVGFAALVQLQRQHGVRDGFRRYNGSGRAAEAYADDAMAKLARWRARLGPNNHVPDPATGGETAVLRRGSQGPAVEQLQRVLNAWYPVADLAEDSDYGPATATVVRLLQERAGLVVDGVVGPQTRAVLGL